MRLRQRSRLPASCNWRSVCLIAGMRKLPALTSSATLRSERPGLAVGAVLAPITGLVSWLRRARMFHPDGAVNGTLEAVEGVSASTGHHLEALVVVITADITLAVCPSLAETGEPTDEEVIGHCEPHRH